MKIEMEFAEFGKMVSDRLDSFATGEIFVTVDGDALWNVYLAAFPEGSNPMYKERTEHDCTCCKNFIRNVGNIVAVGRDGKLTTLWDVPARSPYKEVAEALHAFVLSTPITDVWRTAERKYGAKTTKQMLADGKVINWDHFYGNVPARNFSTTPDKARGDFRTTVQVFKRGLTELTESALETVLDLINSKSLYRGEEHLPAIRAFRDAKARFDSSSDKGSFPWLNVEGAAARFKNTVIGTLVEDLSSGVDLEKAVRSFEVKVAPTNYKRPTALITESMVKAALKTIRELDLEASLDRRYGKISDITVNNVLWVNRGVRGNMKSGIESLLTSEAKRTKAPTKTAGNDIGIDDFLRNILPKSEAVEVLVKNSHINKFVTLTAPVNGDSGGLFKWSNDFAWSYNGDVADSISERVKKAGGNVDNAKLRFSLGWTNYDDLDIHVNTPSDLIYFGNKRSRCGGVLDVDMNAGGGNTREPVENVSFNNPRDGVYEIHINQYSRRETVDMGFTLEIADTSSVRQYSYPAAVTDKVRAATVTVKNGVITDVVIGKGLTNHAASTPVWGVNTETFVEVDALTLSPNYWDDNAVGNKHWFFLLKGCKAPGAARGIYNEFLNPKLDGHRKVFEVLGSKSKTQPSDDQLSGVGFSSTRSDTVTVRVTGEVRGTYNITF
jgi:hypothetical protein